MGFLTAPFPSPFRLNSSALCRPATALLIGIALNPGTATAQVAPSSQPQANIVAARPASPIQDGSAEWGWTSGGAADLPGGARGGSFWAAQLRWGRVLTAPHGPGPLRGTLEYAFEIVPALVLRQSGTVFGGGLNPLLLQYNFTAGRRVVPFVQAGGGMLFTTREFPVRTAQFNFTPQGGGGVYWMRWPRATWMFGARFHHISNAGRVRPNPGHNALYLYTGVSWWR